MDSTSSEADRDVQNSEVLRLQGSAEAWQRVRRRAEGGDHPTDQGLAEVVEVHGIPKPHGQDAWPARYVAKRLRDHVHLGGGGRPRVPMRLRIYRGAVAEKVDICKTLLTNRRTRPLDRSPLEQALVEVASEEGVPVETLRAWRRDKKNASAVKAVREKHRVRPGRGTAPGGAGGRAITDHATNDREQEPAPRRYVLEAEAGEMKITGHPVGITIEGDPLDSEGRRVDSRPASGGRAFSTTDAAGRYEVQLEGPLDVGKPNEVYVLETLLNAMRAGRIDAFALPGALDDRGEDGKLMVEGAEMTVDVTILVAEPTVRRLKERGAAHSRDDLAGAVAMLRAALERKRGHAPSGDVLALDGSHLGAVLGPRLVDAYHAAHGDPAAEYGWSSVWLVGPTPRSTFRLEEATGTRPIIDG